MLEFLGIIFLVMILYTFLTSDEVCISIKVDGKEVIHYERKDAEEKNDKKNKKDLK
jgi:hypothetical protein